MKKKIFFNFSYKNFLDFVSVFSENVFYSSKIHKKQETGNIIYSSKKTNSDENYSNDKVGSSKNKNEVEREENIT